MIRIKEINKNEPQIQLGVSGSNFKQPILILNSSI